MNAHIVYLFVIVFLGGTVYLFWRLFQMAREQEEEYRDDLQIANQTIKDLKKISETYKEEKERYEQKINAVTGNSGSGDCIGLDLLQDLHESGKSRNRKG